MDSTRRSTKRRRLSPPSEDSAIPQTDQTPVATPTARGTLKRPTRHRPPPPPTEDEAQIFAENAASEERRKRGKAIEDASVYDDIDGALTGAPPRQLRRSGRGNKEAESPAHTKRDQGDDGRKGQNRPRTAALADQEVVGEEERKEDDSTIATNPESANTKPKRAYRRKAKQQDRNLVDDDILESIATPASRASKQEGKRTAASRTQAGNEETVETYQPIETPKPSRAKSSRRSKTLAEENRDDSGETFTPPSRRKATLSNGKGSDRSKTLLNVVDHDDDPDPGASNEFADAITKASPRVGKQVNGNVVSKNATPKPTDNDQLDLLKTIILEKLNGRRQISLIGLENEYQKVNQLVEQTVNAGEGNSMLIIGARGSGKSALVKQALTELAKEQRNNFHIVRLNGFVHTDDKIALREIWRQLGKEMDIEDSLGKNYADTLSTLLALLSHPSELAGQESDEVAKAVIFVMDEFDLFASHPRQTLLYNLFDIAQSRKAPIAVLGLTTRIGVADNLEKRVKSRFSHRYVHLSLAKSFDSFQEICKSALSLSSEDMSIEEQGLLSMTGAKNTKSTSKSNLLDQWNDFVMHLFEDPSFIKHDLAPFYHLGKSVPAALTSFHLPISQLSPASFPPQPTHFSNQQSALLQPPDSKLSLLAGLTDLQLALLIAAARLDIIHDTDSCNFNMAYAEYVSLASRAKIQTAAAGAIASGAGTKVWGRHVARGEWEKLLEWELMIPVAGAGAGGGAAATAMVRVDVALEEIAPSVPGLDRVMERWCKHI